jgi:hypothetical protein
MTKGYGQAILNQMISEGILKLEGRMYILSPEKLQSQTQASYADVMARNFNKNTVEFVRRALNS